MHVIAARCSDCTQVARLLSSGSEDPNGGGDGRDCPDEWTGEPARKTDVPRYDQHDHEGRINHPEHDEIEPVTESIVDTIEDPADGYRLTAEDDCAHEEHQAFRLEFPGREPSTGPNNDHRYPKAKVE